MSGFTCSQTRSVYEAVIREAAVQTPKVSCRREMIELVRQKHVLFLNGEFEQCKMLQVALTEWKVRRTIGAWNLRQIRRWLAGRSEEASTLVLQRLDGCLQAGELAEVGVHHPVSLHRSLGSCYHAPR